jgi:hypothetical protein
MMIILMIVLSTIMIMIMLMIVLMLMLNVSKKRKSLDEIHPAISTAKRVFRFGAGHEEHVGVGYTPGFEWDPYPSITPEGHGFKKHLVFWSPRNTR